MGRIIKVIQDGIDDCHLPLKPRYPYFNVWKSQPLKSGLTYTSSYSLFPTASTGYQFMPNPRQ